MPRIARIVGEGLPHHVTQRGNYQQKVFETDADYRRYLALVSEYSNRNSLSVLAYCLMRNHVHFLVVPKTARSLSNSFKCAHMRYAQYFNCSHQVSGHLWKGRFYSCLLGGSHMLAAARYIERNPVRAGLVRRAEDWAWSSARAHCGLGAGNFAFSLEELWRHIELTPAGWAEFLMGFDRESDLDYLREHTSSGLPVTAGN